MNQYIGRLSEKHKVHLVNDYCQIEALLKLKVQVITDSYGLLLVLVQ